MRALGLLLVSGLTACGPKLDPLAPLKAELGEARQKGPMQHPHLRFAVAEDTVLSIVEQAAGLEKPRVVPLGMGAAATISVEVDEPDLTVTPGPACDCPHVHLDVQGRFDASVGSLLGILKLADGMGFQASLDGAIELGLRGTDEGQVIELLPVPEDAWRADVQLAEEKGFLSNKAVEKQLDNLFANALAKPTQLGRIPKTVPARAARIELQPAEHPTAAVWLQARPLAEAVPAPVPDEGWVLSTSDEALLHGARAALARAPQHPDWKLEPRSIDLSDGTFEAVLRVHKVARRLKWRDYRVRGTVELGDTLSIRGTEVEEIDKKGFGGSLVGPFVKGRVRREVLKLDLDFPRSTRQPVGKERGLVWTIDRLDTADTTVRLEGSVRAIESMDAP